MKQNLLDTSLERQTRNSELAALIENIPGGLHQCHADPFLTLISMSDGFLDLFGYTRAEISALFEDRFIEMIYPDDRAAVLEKLAERAARGASMELEYRACTHDGTVLWILDKSRLAVSPDGAVTFYCMLIDITDRKKEQEALRLSLERHKVIMDQTTDIIFEWDIRADTLDFSPNWRKKFGYDAIGSEISTRIPLSENIHPVDMQSFVKLMKDSAAGVPYSETEFRIRSAYGWYTWCRVRATVQYDAVGQPIKAVGVVSDIDAEKKQKEQLLELAHKDALTGLYNKRTIQMLVEERIRQSHELEYQIMMIIDVDNFKAVNDIYGHPRGDLLLSEVAETLRRLFRATDLVGRIGGDEFLIYLPEISDLEAATAKATSVLAATRKIRLAPGAEAISCSIGISFFPNQTADYYAMYQCADRALYYIKDSGKNSYAFYSPSLCRDSIPCGLARSAIGEIIDPENTSPVDEALAKYVFEMLYSAADVKTTVAQILETVGMAYNVSRAYIFESSEDGRRCSNTFEWCDTGVEPEIGKLKNLSYLEDLGDYLRNFDEQGVFYCRDIAALKPCLYAVLAPQGIDSLLQCAILDNGKFKGYIGFDECRGKRSWTKEQIASLTLAANVLSTFLMKLRLEERLEGLEPGQGEK